jgi:hypothetical protein
VEKLRIIAALVAVLAAGSASAGPDGNGNGASVDKGGFLLNVNTFEQCPGGIAEGDPLEPTFTQYEVRARVLGQPGGSVTVTSCVEEAADDAIVVDDDNTDPEILCSVGEGNIWVQTRTVGSGKEQNKWENVSTQLLTVCVDTDGDVNMTCDDRLGLFDPAGEGYWWNWDAQGRPHVQLVFYPVQSGI